MAKYSYEFKKQVVDDYLSGKGGCEYLERKYNISNTGENKIVSRWVKAYQAFGDEALMRSRKKQNYSFQFKLHVVELYLTTEISYQDLALSVGVTNLSMISRWVNDFRIAGPDALKPKRKGRPAKVTKPKETKQIKGASKTGDAQYLKHLEEENLKLRIENAYLKELRRLRLEEKPQKEKRESSTASEEHSD